MIRDPEHARPTQRQQVLWLLRERGEDGVTPKLARDEIGTDRLAARVLELKNDGHVIVREWHVTESGARVARYVLREAWSPRTSPIWPSL
jgi:L-rhamnose isomerase